MPIEHLQIKNFRNHIDLSIRSNAKFVNIVGQNGVGKTNVLEAISFFSPGRGFRNSKYDEIININTDDNFWYANCEINCSDDENLLYTGFQLTQNGKRNVKINETNYASANNYLSFLRIVWLTPKLDSTLGESSAARRKFFDRMCFNVYPQHAADVNKLENAIRSRNKLIKENFNDKYWLSAYEHIIAEQSIIIAKTRKYLIDQLIESLKEFTSNFLKPTITLNCAITDCLNEMDNKKLLEELLIKQEKARETDRYKGRSSIGAHKTEFVIMHPFKKIVASLCSTGEQKAMIISTLIAHLKCIEKNFNGAIILLLDDIFSHLDYMRKKELIEELNMTQAQVWIASTDIDDHLFESKDNVKIYI